MQEHQISKADFEACMKCNICTEVCPMYEVNPLYQGPKKSGPDAERYRLKDPAFFDSNLKFCLNCKRCETACPSGVKVADIIQMAKLKYSSSTHPLRDTALSSTDLVGSVASVFAPAVNFALEQEVASKAMGLLGVDSHSVFPKYASEKFVTWFRRNARKSQDSFGSQVNYFHGCYVNYNNPQQGKDLVKILNACNVGVKLMKGEKCCGVAMMANGFRDRAAANAASNVEMFSKVDGPILCTSSTCAFTMRQEYPEVLGVDNSKVKDSIMLATKWLFEEVESGRIRLAFRQDFRMKVVYHIPCHLQRLGWQMYSIALMRMIPGLTLAVPEQECCGIAGTFGFKKEYAGYSRKIGSKLFENLRSANPQVVATDCETCRFQIEMGTPFTVMHPLAILAEALDIEITKELNETDN
ncbi:MAG: anaerobic glycerol-3-phosphate dehydrogenase subunit C [Bacteroidales bacterium]|nr:anaerobic glycerol-3-phosphate dehydrogenase subunit C [Bacteroidales bacterium]